MVDWWYDTHIALKGAFFSRWRLIAHFSNMRFQTKATAVSTAQVLPMIDSGYIGL